MLWMQSLTSTRKEGASAITTLKRQVAEQVAESTQFTSILELFSRKKLVNMDHSTFV